VILVGVSLMGFGSLAVLAQRTATTTLMVRVSPEAHLNPTQIQLHYQISADGSSDLISQTERIAAWVRVPPGQQIRLTARFAPLVGPQGALSDAVIGWTGASIHSTHGGQEATCTGGTAVVDSSHDMISGWHRSGTVTCAVTFVLASARMLPPGRYTADVDLNLRTE
jgi:hypothetical protein